MSGAGASVAGAARSAEVDVRQIPNQAGLGTLLRHLVELLDGDVEAVYREQGLECRSRFTPVIRHLEAEGPSSIRQIALASGLTHSAISQTVAEMLKKNLVESAPGKDARERIISFTQEGRALLPRLHAVWDAIWAAADDLSADLGQPLGELLGRTVDAVVRRPFRQRILERMDSASAGNANAAEADERRRLTW
jgi:DNA-binding MarR family transcriptional regulator